MPRPSHRAGLATACGRVRWAVRPTGRCAVGDNRFGACGRAMRFPAPWVAPRWWTRYHAAAGEACLAPTPPGGLAKWTSGGPCARYGPRMEPQRKETRLRGYDYAQSGLYFVTICCHERVPWFGVVRGGQMLMNDVGRVVSGCWEAIPAHYHGVVLDEFVLMPDHLHGVIGLLPGRDDLEEGERRNREGSAGGMAPRRARRASPLLGTVVGSFKSAAARLVNIHCGTSGATVWQRGYDEHIVRNEEDLRRIREYIAMNPSMSHVPHP